MPRLIKSLFIVSYVVTGAALTSAISPEFITAVTPLIPKSYLPIVLAGTTFLNLFLPSISKRITLREARHIDKQATLYWWETGQVKLDPSTYRGFHDSANEMSEDIR